MKLTYKIKDEVNITYVLKNRLHISDRLCRKIKNSNDKLNRILINNNPVELCEKIKKDDILTVDLDFIENNDNIISNGDVLIDVLYEDDWFIILNKQAGIPIHPSINHYENSLSNGLKYYYEQNNIHKKIRPVNRLDKNTSGVVLFAKSEYVQEQIIYQMNKNSFIKEYLALVDGKLIGSGVINKPIARKLPSIMERCISDDGQQAITEYEVLKNYNDKYTLIRCKLLTGRTHQIRVHMKSIGHPVLGDTLYGNESPLINRQALHAYKVSFVHPINNKTLEICAEIPSDMFELINRPIKTN